eukprot:TRINITY_DN13693_c0_g1_i1.p1 TRINITY_DN13693_c0_g1~~TRINITY_DN13693_c0_g1_i1.p1  ORF type:complete len:669 (-),score=139.26 TRINITY_DN13693_c0_g1_i1:76-2082(-)
MSDSRPGTVQDATASAASASDLKAGSPALTKEVSSKVFPKESTLGLYDWFAQQLHAERREILMRHELILGELALLAEGKSLLQTGESAASMMADIISQAVQVAEASLDITTAEDVLKKAAEEKLRMPAGDLDEKSCAKPLEEEKLVIAEDLAEKQGRGNTNELQVKDDFAKSRGPETVKSVGEEHEVHAFKSFNWEAAKSTNENTNCNGSPDGAENLDEQQTPKQGRASQHGERGRVLVAKQGSASSVASSFAAGASQSYVQCSWNPTQWAKSTAFDMVVCGVIVVNTVLMAVAMQYDGFELGYQLGYRGYDIPAAIAWPGAAELFGAMEILFGLIFTVELIIKIVGLKIQIFKDPWAYMDFLIVIAFYTELIIGELPMDPMPLRLARLARLLRLLRLVRTIQGFDALYVLTTAMRSSFSVLGWSFLLLFVVLLLQSFLAHQLLAPVMSDDSRSEEVRKELFIYFGTSSRCLLTMFEMTLANWIPVARMLIEDVGEWYSIFAIANKITIGFAVVGIINGVFMQETFKVAASDDIIMMRQTERTTKLHCKKMQALFVHADSSGDGLLVKEEFREVMKDPQVTTWLAAQELTVNDPDTLFELLSTHGHIAVDDLVQGVARLKGPARSMDMAEQNMHIAHALSQIASLEQTTLELMRRCESLIEERTKWST